MFVLERRLELGKFEGWKECYVIFNSPKVEDINGFTSNEKDAGQNIGAGNELLAKNVVSGKGWDGTKLIDITKSNISKLPLEIWTECIRFLVAGNSQK